MVKGGKNHYTAPVLDASAEAMREYLVSKNVPYISKTWTAWYVTSFFVVLAALLLQVSFSLSAVKTTESGKTTSFFESVQIWKDLTKTYKIEDPNNASTDEAILAMENSEQAMSNLKATTRNLTLVSVSSALIGCAMAAAFAVVLAKNHLKSSTTSLSKPWWVTPVARTYGYVALNVWMGLVCGVLLLGGIFAFTFANSLKKLSQCFEKSLEDRKNNITPVLPCKVQDYASNKYKVKVLNAVTILMILLTLIPIIYLSIELFIPNTFMKNKDDVLGGRISIQATPR